MRGIRDLSLVAAPTNNILTIDRDQMKSYQFNRITVVEAN